MTDHRRVYFDHDPFYRQIAAQGGRGWDDRLPGVDHGSYLALEWFLASEFSPRNPRDLHAVDLGCGGGQVALRLADMGFRVTGVDFSEAAIEMARQNAAERLGQVSSAASRLDSAKVVHTEYPVPEFIVGDCRSLPQFADGEFDLAVDNHVLHCLIEPSDRLAFLGTARRLLRPGGLLFSETMSAEGVLDMCALGINPATRIDSRRSRFWVTATELNREIAASGFEILHQELRSQPDLPSPGDSIVTVAVSQSM